MRRILVTGASGFIGRHCLPVLETAGWEVHAVSSRQRTSGTVRWHHADLLDPTSISALIRAARPETLLHLAWYSIPALYWAALENLDWVQASLALLRAFDGCGGRRVLVAGTCAEYEWSNSICRECDTPLAPKTLYGVSKHALEQIARAFAIETDIEVVWARMFGVYGPHENPSRLVPSIVRPLLRGESATCLHGDYIRDYLFVEDVAEALVALLGSTVRGPINIASGQPIVLGDLASRIASLLGREDQMEVLPGVESRDNDRIVLGSNERLRTDLGWHPRFDLESGLQVSIAFWRANALGKANG